MKKKNRVGSEVAVFLRTDVTKYDDLKALFSLAESKFGGIDVSYYSKKIAAKQILNNNCIPNTVQ